MKKAIGYVRVSTADQRENGVSLEAQKEKITGYCKLYDLKLVGILEDAGLSGKNMDRPQLERALQMIESGEAEVLVIYKLDRLSRSMGDFHNILKMYFTNDKKPRTLISVNENIDTNGANGKLMVNLLMSFAQFESDITSERTKTSLAFRKSQGLHNGSVPVGYRLEEGALVPSDDYSVISTMKRLRTQGNGYDKIAQHLNDHNVPTQRGGNWTGTTVKRILDREAKVA